MHVMAPSTVDTALYAEVQQFYARHLQLLDDGRAEEWAATFTEDGVFAPEHRPAPVVGRTALAEGAGRSQAELAKTGEVRRHWHGMVAVDPRDDGTVRVRCYALIVGTRPGEETRIVMSCVCEDVLVRGDAGELLVRERRVTRDGV